MHLFKCSSEQINDDDDDDDDVYKVRTSQLWSEDVISNVISKISHVLILLSGR